VSKVMNTISPRYWNDWLTVTQLLIKSFALQWTWSFITVFTRTHHVLKLQVYVDYFTIFWVSQVIEHQMVVWHMNAKYERTWREAVNP
jgi:hypothetical protein